MLELKKLHKILKWWFDKTEAERNALEVEYGFIVGQDAVDFVTYVYVMEGP